MKICRFVFDNEIKAGILKEDLIFPFSEKESFDCADVNVDNSIEPIKTSTVRFLPPSAPSKIVCIGRNYAEHAAELGNDVPSEPLIFLKSPSSLITNDGPIVLPVQSKQVECEGELAVVVGRHCKDLDEKSNPFDYVAGYACLNDVTARDLQRQDIQFTRAKSFDSFCPVSHFFETAVDVTNLQITTKINDVVRQNSRTSRMVFSIAFIIKYISRQMSLLPGDIIATGTPSGVSRLNAGDICEIQIEGIGSLRNPVK